MFHYKPLIPENVIEGLFIDSNTLVWYLSGYSQSFWFLGTAPPPGEKCPSRHWRGWGVLLGYRRASMCSRLHTGLATEWSLGTLCKAAMEVHRSSSAAQEHAKGKHTRSSWRLSRKGQQKYLLEVLNLITSLLSVVARAFWYIWPLFQKFKVNSSQGEPEDKRTRQAMLNIPVVQLVNCTVVFPSKRRRRGIVTACCCLRAHFARPQLFE